jgi:hypothetical protein
VESIIAVLSEDQGKGLPISCPFAKVGDRRFVGLVSSGRILELIIARRQGIAPCLGQLGAALETFGVRLGLISETKKSHGGRAAPVAEESLLESSTPFAHNGGEKKRPTHCREESKQPGDKRILAKTQRDDDNREGDD